MILLIILCLLNISRNSSRKTVIVTGGNRGIGFKAVEKLAETGEWNVIIASRDLNLAEKARNNIKIGKEYCEVQKLDLASIDDVNRFCKEWKAQKRPLHVIACNAGVQFSSGSKNPIPKFTKDEFEATVGTNHIGHFLLIQNLVDQLDKKSSRIVIVGSGVHNPEEPGGDVGSKATLGELSGIISGFKKPITMIDNSNYDADKAYKDSKLCNVMTALELARRLKSKRMITTCNVMNPGLIPTTGLFRELNPVFVFLFTILTRYVFKVAATEEEGGARLAFMISDSSLNDVTGKYFSGKPGKKEFKTIEASKEAKNLEKSKKLWEATAKIVKVSKI